ncbi:hypothetical protein TNCV_764711 [Trichonephila clavipes]|nr:hypothetical protein TNCV_764711 [Trichonephila clavipes]
MSPSSSKPCIPKIFGRQQISSESVSRLKRESFGVGWGVVVWGSVTKASILRSSTSRLSKPHMTQNDFFFRQCRDYYSVIGPCHPS